MSGWRVGGLLLLAQCAASKPLAPVESSNGHPPINQEPDDSAAYGNMLVAEGSDAAQPIPDYSEWVRYNESHPDDTNVRDAALPDWLPCPNGAPSAAWVDVNVLRRRAPRHNSRVTVSGIVRDVGGRFVLDSACRPVRTSTAMFVTLSPRMGGCAKSGDYVTVDAKLVDLSQASLMGTFDRKPGDGELVDALVVGYPSASALCNFSRAHPE